MSKFDLAWVDLFGDGSMPTSRSSVAYHVGGCVMDEFEHVNHRGVGVCAARVARQAAPGVDE
jgi:hypothetical protein